MATVEAPANHHARIPVEQRFVLPAVDWTTYQAISKALTGRHVRLSYDGENLEFMTISPTHGNYSRLLGRFVVVLTEEAGLPLKSFGDMTCEREGVGQGLEPDECFYITNEPSVRENERIDLTFDPPPDLALEIDISRSSRDRMVIYAALQVPEVWRFNGDKLVACGLGEDGRYSTVDHSRYFPKVPVAELANFLKRRAQTDENTLVGRFRAWARQQVAKPDRH